MNRYTRILTSQLLLVLLVSCDPDVNVDYFIVNETDENLQVRIYGLNSSYQMTIQPYDTVVSVNQKINICSFWYLGDDYINPADTITIYDSIHVIRNNVKTRSDLKSLDSWTYSENPGKWGGGQYIYELRIKNKDF